MPEWELVKRRTAVAGEVWRSLSGDLFKKTGDESLRTEISFQRSLLAQGFPVPEIVESGEVAGVQFLVERSLGKMSLHDLALRDFSEVGVVRDETIEKAIDISTVLLKAQIRNATAPKPGDLEAWICKAAFLDNVLQENPDFDNDRVRNSIAVLKTRLSGTPLCLGHLDYGMPNAFPTGVIDWQHHAKSPIGFDVYPMLDIAAFKGGSRGYSFTQDQRSRYVAELDNTALDLLGKTLSVHIGDFLFIKSFFFLALMKPKSSSKRSKYEKWQHRRRLFLASLDQYETATLAARTDPFPANSAPRHTIRRSAAQRDSS